MEPMGSARLEERRKQFMGGVDISDQRQRRENFAIELRKQKRMETSSKRRRLTTSAYSAQISDGPETLVIDSMSGFLTSNFPQLLSASLSDVDRAKLLKDILDTPQRPEVYYEVLSVLRKALAKDMNPPIRTVAGLGLVPIFMSFVNAGQYPTEIVYEATWALTNLVSGPHDIAESVVQAGGVPLFLSVLDPSHPEVNEHAIWGLGNIAGDCIPFRDLVIAARGHEAVVGLVLQSEHIEASHARVMAWALATFVRGKPVAPLNVCEEVIKALEQLVKLDDLDTHREALWALSNISDGENSYSQLVISANLGKFALSCISTENLGMTMPAIRVLGNIASGDDVMTQHALDLGLLDVLLPLIDCHEYVIRKEVMWTLSNVTAGTKEQIQLFVNHEICGRAIKGLEDPVYAVRKEASWIFNNVARQGKPDQRMSLVDANIFAYLKTLLKCEPDVISNALAIIRGLFSAGMEQSRLLNQSFNPATRKFEQTGCLPDLEALQLCTNEDLAHEALAIIADFFTIEDPVEALGDAPAPELRFQFN